MCYNAAVDVWLEFPLWSLKVVFLSNWQSAVSFIIELYSQSSSLAATYTMYLNFPSVGRSLQDADVRIVGGDSKVSVATKMAMTIAGTYGLVICRTGSMFLNFHIETFIVSRYKIAMEYINTLGDD